MHTYINYDSLYRLTKVIYDASNFTAYGYDDNGNIKETGEAQFKNDAKFTGALHDTSAGLYYMNSRFYNPNTGRFLSQDTYSGNPYDPWTQHLYSYTSNNPVNFIDPTGHMMVSVTDDVAGTSVDDTSGVSSSTSSVSKYIEIAASFIQGAAAGIVESITLGKSSELDNSYARYNETAYYLGRMCGNGIMVLGGGIGTEAFGSGALITSPTVVASAGLAAGAIYSAGVTATATDDLFTNTMKFAQTVRVGQAPKIVNKLGKAYPEIKDPRTGENIKFPEGKLNKVPKSQRVEWNNQTRADYIKEWYDRGYNTPEGGWGKYDIHHIKPREYGGDNSFDNLVPVDRTLHQNEFSSFWLGY